ncbi:unnamed protein product [Hermetia illucens]|uniref:cAMP-dependent protein kinase catalytic subunit n=1 Tax=Hermetia illucens TaxID=343691 RepID=A0A7R8YMT7_HERIL|nr:cAMP-dependent protein kinase catalytic subunit beta-like [Hermetia illucens]CAD7078873.1 unnamed protein product [Hermetia illucens]
MSVEGFSTKVEYTEILKKLKVEFFTKYDSAKPSPKIDFQEFEPVIIVGSGSFGTVKLCKQKKTNKYYAVKVLFKSNIVKNKQVEHVVSEKKILGALNFPFVIHMELSFKDNDCLYLVMPFISGGELFTYLRKMKRFDEVQAKFYGAQVFLAFEYLHYLNLIYRDLKPENILLDQLGYIKLTDFGFCKHIESRTWTLCGTPEYIAPELIKTKGYGQSVDWWAFGVLIYELVAGVSPFYTANTDPMALFRKIVDCNYKIPTFFSHDLRHLVYNLLQVDTSRRYGNLRNGAQDIKTHSWFKNTNWIGLLNYEIEAPYVPKTKGSHDTTNFDKYPEQKFVPSKTNQYEKEFENF